VQPQAQQESIFRTFFGDLEVGVVDLVVLDRLLGATSKKGRQLFLRKKCTPRQNPGYAYDKKFAHRSSSSSSSSTNFIATQVLNKTSGPLKFCLRLVSR